MNRQKHLCSLVRLSANWTNTSVSTHSEGIMCSTYTTLAHLLYLETVAWILMVFVLCLHARPNCIFLLSCLFTRRLETFEMRTTRVSRKCIVYGENTDCTAKRHGN